MLPLLKRIVRWVVAITLIVIGLALSIPGVPGPGFLVILVGIFVLLPESRWLRKKYAALSPADRRDVLEILRDTKPDFPRVAMSNR